MDIMTSQIPKPAAVIATENSTTSSSSIFNMSDDETPECVAKDLAMNYVDEEAIRVFDKSLNESAPEESSVEMITSVSDFAPIHERIRRSKTLVKRRKDAGRQSWGYSITRWPLLISIFVIIGVEFMLYGWVRQLVNMLEWAWTWRGYRQKLRTKLHDAKDYQEWKQAANAMDEHFGYDEWKKDPSFAYYDWKLVQRVTTNLREMRQNGDAENVQAILEVCLKNNFAGIESARLYSETYYGTKHLIEEYTDEVSKSIQFLNQTTTISPQEKAAFFYNTSNSLGTTALCLSGGAVFGYYHFGVVRALLDANLLPRVITGTSAGALVASLVCTRTDSELKRLLVPQLADNITACEEPITVWMKRFMRTGARFDTVKWARKASFFTMGSMTFREAYERTGRALNVSVVPYDPHSPTKLLNFITAPDCVIFSAIIASAAVPGIINPVVLLTKSKDGKIKPWEYQGRHKDGSLRVDIPLQSLHNFHNVNFSIVSQVNPHVHIFAFSPRGAPGRPVSGSGKVWRGGFLLSAVEGVLKLELFKNLRMIRDLELLPEFYGQNWSAVFLQKFEGTVTIWPKSHIRDFFRLLSDPDRKELARMIDVGIRVTWPRIHMIENRSKIESQLDQGRKKFCGSDITRGRHHVESQFFTRQSQQPQPQAYVHSSLQNQQKQQELAQNGQHMQYAGDGDGEKETNQGEDQYEQEQDKGKEQKQEQQHEPTSPHDKSIKRQEYVKKLGIDKPSEDLENPYFEDYMKDFMKEDPRDRLYPSSTEQDQHQHQHLHPSSQPQSQSQIQAQSQSSRQRRRGLHGLRKKRSLVKKNWAQLLGVGGSSNKKGGNSTPSTSALSSSRPSPSASRASSDIDEMPHQRTIPQRSSMMFEYSSDDQSLSPSAKRYRTSEET